jgi:microsomal dipeptidase-like Zn-dependent dipeptidase
MWLVPERLSACSVGARAGDSPQYNIQMPYVTFLLLCAVSHAAPAAPAPLWGFADLHAHLAAHLGFGAGANGEDGILWGKPGLALDNAESTLTTDMPPCPAETHGHDRDLVRQGTRAELLKQLDSSTGWTHSASGSPAFEAWPNARSLDHQQMHILAVRRAYEGGLRLMIATAVDNELLATLWTKIGFNLLGNQMPPPTPNFYYDSARRQIDFISNLAAHNGSWMRVVTTAAEARQAIRENKLAIILGLEMDVLSADQALDLVNNHQVRHIIPIHLANNAFGGTAIAGDLFNSSNQYLTGSFFQAACAPEIAFKLGRPMIMKSSGSVLAPGAVLPFPLEDPAYQKLGYSKCAGGHRNAEGLQPAYNALFDKLMHKGVLIDIAHMSELSAEGAIQLAEAHHYPLMNSHTDFRHACPAGPECGRTERDLKRSDAQRLAALGGVVGFGTATTAEHKLLEAHGNSPLAHFTSSAPEWSRSVHFTGPRASQPISRLWLTVTTGNHALAASSHVSVTIRTHGARQITFANVNEGRGWLSHSTHLVNLPLSLPVRFEDISGLTVQARLEPTLFGSDWNIDSVTLSAAERELDPVGQWLRDYQDALSVMGGRGLALGTDMNGFSPGVPFSAAPVHYPFTVGSNSFRKFRLGTRIYDFQTDGLAHYGMLPDFLEAVAERRDLQPEQALRALYHSAEDVVAMWERAEAANH